MFNMIVVCTRIYLGCEINFSCDVSFPIGGIMSTTRRVEDTGVTECLGFGFLRFSSFRVFIFAGLVLYFFLLQRYRLRR